MNFLQLQQALLQHFEEWIDNAEVKDMVTIEVHPANLERVCRALRDHDTFKFEQCVDVCGLDYLDYGLSYWRTEDVNAAGYNRAVASDAPVRVIEWNKPRFAVVYHLLSVTHNHRLRVRTFLSEEMRCPSLIDIWASVNWYEREVFDLFGIVFDGHPDLRRLLTDYGFKGHPFRKDFPLIGEVEMRYDAKQQRCIYEPVSIQPRTLVPKVIRDDNRYLSSNSEQES